MRKVLGLDLSFTSSGYYFLEEGKESTVHGCITTKPADFSTDLHRIDHIANIILDLIKEHKPDIVAIEDFYVGRVSFSATKIISLGSIVRYLILKTGTPFILIAPSQLKKFATGSGVAKKDNMLLSVYKKYKFETKYNDVADACIAANFGVGYLRFLSEEKDDMLKYELEVLNDFNKKREIIKL